MLIQTAYNLLPNKQSCNNGSVLYGSAVSSMSAALSQLSHVKFLGMSNYSVMRSTYNDTFTRGYSSSRLAEGVGRITKGYSEEHKFFYASTPLSTWLGVVLAYESGSNQADPSSTEFSPQIDISIKVLDGTPLAEIGTADYGIRLDSTNGLLLASISGADAVVGETRVSTHYAESNIEIPSSPPSNTSPVSPRPLYIPESVTISSTTYQVRGNIVSINVSCSDCKLRHFTTFDLYQPEL
jgi:hypothetical protein